MTDENVTFSQNEDTYDPKTMAHGWHHFDLSFTS